MSVPTDQVRERIAQAKARLKLQLAQRRTEQSQKTKEKLEQHGADNNQSKKAISIEGDMENQHLESKSVTECNLSSSNSILRAPGKKAIPAWRLLQIEEISKRQSGISIGSSKPSLEEMDARTQALLSRFHSSLKKATTPVELPEKNVENLNVVVDGPTGNVMVDVSRVPCALHSIIGCKSCIAASLNTEEITQAEAESGWKSHHLFFEKEAGERQLKADAENLLVIDPRERMADLHSIPKRTRK